MSVPKSRTKPDLGQNYRVPAQIVAWAKAQATKRCKATGQPVTWSQIIRETLEAAAKE
jgi:hypothetical protein